MAFLMQEESISKSIIKLTRHSVVYGIGHILNRAVGFLLLPVYTNLIEPEQLGVAAMAFLFLGFMTIVYQLGFNQAFLRYFGMNSDAAERRKIFSNSFLAVFFLSFFFSILLFFTSRDISNFLFHSEKYANLIWLSIGILIGDVLGQIPLIALRVEEKSFSYLLITLLQIFLNVFFNIYFIVYQKMGITGIFAANFISSLALLIFLSPIIKKYFQLKIQSEQIRLLFLFGFPYMFSGLAKVIMDLADRFLLERMTNFKTVGIYNAGYKLAGIMGLVVAGFRFAWMPYSLSVAKRKDARRIYSLITTYFILISGWIFLFFIFFLEPVIKIHVGNFYIFGEKYWKGISIVPLIMASYILYGLYAILIVEIYIKERSKVLPIITGSGAVINIFGNLLLIPIFGMFGAAWATLISYLIMVIILFRDTQRNYTVPFELKRIGLILLIYSGIIILGYFSHFRFNLILKSLLLLIVPVILYFSGFFHREEIQIFKNVRQKM